MARHATTRPVFTGLMTAVLLGLGTASWHSLLADDTPKATAEQAAQKESAEYLELLRLFADVVDQVDRNYVREVDRRKLIEGAIRGMMEELDPYSNYIPRKDLERFRRGVESEYGGIGIQVTTDNGILEVITPMYGTPAYKAGLLPGDKITEIEGTSTKGVTIDEAIKLMKGKVGTKVKIKVLHPDAKEPVEMALDREIIRVQTVLGDHRKKDDSWEFFIDLQQKIGYIRITAFGRHTAEELEAAVRQLHSQKLRGLVLDLRDNPGGLLSIAIRISDMFVSDGLIVGTDGRNSPKRTWQAHLPGTYSGFEMAVLVNRYSASASEIVSACLQDHKRAIVIGERTWGKGSVQNIIELESGRSALKLTTAGYTRPSGVNIHKAPDATEDDHWGVRPDDGYLIPMTFEEMRTLNRMRREKERLASQVEGDPEKTDEEPEDIVDKHLDSALKYLREKLAQKS